MAMLVLPEVFERTWGIRSAPFWPRATAAVRARGAGIPVHGRGLLGPRVDAAAAGVRLHLRQAALRPPGARRDGRGSRASAGRPRLPGPPRALPREPRRAARGGDIPAGRPPRGGGGHLPHARACASSTRGSAKEARANPNAPRPGAGRSAGRRRSARSTTACSRVCETRRSATGSGNCSTPARPGRATARTTRSSRSHGPDRAISRRLVVVNYAGHQSQCYVALPWRDLAGRTWRLQDRLGEAVYDRDGGDLVDAGPLPRPAAVGLPRVRGAGSLTDERLEFGVSPGRGRLANRAGSAGRENASRCAGFRISLAGWR